MATANERLVLESRAARAESTASQEARALRARLQEGDFHPGDRITLSVLGEPTLSNTFVVGVGNTLTIPSLPEISLRGVLRTELPDVLLREIRRFIKDPEIHVTTFVTVAVLGAIGHSGFFSVPPDAPITDVLMTAGGLTPNADLGRSHIERDGQELIGAKRMREILESNRTVDGIGLRSGDQIVIGDRPHRWQNLTAILSVGGLLVSTFVLLRR